MTYFLESEDKSTLSVDKNQENKYYVESTLINDELQETPLNDYIDSELLKIDEPLYDEEISYRKKIGTIKDIISSNV